MMQATCWVTPVLQQPAKPPSNGHAANLRLTADARMVPTVTSRRTVLLNSARSVCSKAKLMKWLLLETVEFGLAMV